MPDLAQARELLRANQSATALKLLAPHEDAQAGNVAFDYLLGVAALETGDASRASIALERALIVNPNHPVRGWILPVRISRWRIASARAANSTRRWRKTRR